VGLIDVVVLVPTGLDDVEGEAVTELHAGGTENGAERACGPALLADDFADVGGGYMEAQDGNFTIGDSVHLYGCGIVYESADDLAHQTLHTWNGILAVAWI
jgi:hypothetical protein